jgi:serine/threonine protein phosphatase PrpC
VRLLPDAWLVGENVSPRTCSKEGRLSEETQQGECEHHLPFAFFGVFDGHGGDKAAEWVGQNLDKIFVEKIAQHGNQTLPEVLCQALREAILEVENQWMAMAKESKECSGTTAAVVVVKESNFIVGNVGDTEVVLAIGKNPSHFFLWFPSCISIPI